MSESLLLSSSSVNLQTTRALKGTSISKKFHLKHVFRGGAVIWVKGQDGRDYYVVFSSRSRPNRGIQLPGGRIERNENPGEAIMREAREEVGIDTRIICPLGFIYFENQEDNYSSLQMYYLVKPVFPIDVNKKWTYIDEDYTRQELDCWLEPVDRDPEYLAVGQRQIIVMFQKWLEEHRRPEEDNYDQEPNLIEDSDSDIFELN